MFQPLPLATKLWASTNHCPHLPGDLCSLALPRDLWPGANSPGRMQFASGCSNFLQASATTGTTNISQLCLPFPSSPLAWVSEWALISLSRCFCPLLSGQGTDSGGRPTKSVWDNSNAEHQELCDQTGRRGFARAVPRVVAWILAMVLVNPASVEYLNRQWVSPYLKLWNSGATVGFGSKYKVK